MQWPRSQPRDAAVASLSSVKYTAASVLFAITLVAPAYAQSFLDGTYLIGEDVEPGHYQSVGGPHCKWAIFDASATTVTGTGRNQSVEIKADDISFTSHRCGTWRALVVGTVPQPDSGTLSPDHWNQHLSAMTNREVAEMSAVIWQFAVAVTQALGVAINQTEGSDRIALYIFVERWIRDKLDRIVVTTDTGENTKDLVMEYVLALIND